MLVTNQTTQDYWFGPLHLAGGIGQTLTIDDTSETSIYLTNDTVAEAVASAETAGKIAISGAAGTFPRATGAPALLYGDGAPEGSAYAAAGSVYLRRDATATGNVMYLKTTGVALNTGWLPALDGVLTFGNNTGPENLLHGVQLVTDDGTTGDSENGITDSSSGFSLIDDSSSAGGITLQEVGSGALSIINESSTGGLEIVDNSPSGLFINDNGAQGIYILATAANGTSDYGSPTACPGLWLIADSGVTLLQNNGSGLMIASTGVFAEDNPDGVSIEISVDGGGLWIDTGGVPPFNLQFFGIVDDPTDGWDVLMPNLPTSAPTRSGALWNDSGTVKIV